MNCIDLHVHSSASDGTFRPAEVVDRAVSLSLAAFALTDHDTVNGVAEAKERAAWHCAQGRHIEVYSGVEISAAYKNRDIHILGLLVDENEEELRTALDNTLLSRDDRNRKMLERFASLGIQLEMKDLYGDCPDTVVTRGHFARALIAKGIVATPTEAFERYLNYDAPCYVPRGYISPEQAISLILGADGVPVLAHPLLYELSHEELTALIERLKQAGLAGLEVFYSTNRGQDEDNLKALASHFSLLMTGGSDFHGAVKPTIELGVGKGNLKIPYSVLEHVKEAKQAMLNSR